MHVRLNRSGRGRQVGVRSGRQPAALLKLTILAGAMALAGCASIQPKPLSTAEIMAQAQLDRSAAQRDVQPISGPITLEEAIARALKYNLDRRAKMLEEAIAFNQLDLSRYDMLPKLVASAGYQHNSEFTTRRATDSVTGQPSLANPFISSEKSHTVSDLGLTWNLLDFGLSYYGAKQNADRALIAVERRRKAMHALIQDVRTAFWRAASAQKLRDEVKGAIVSAEEALGDARKAEVERVRSPLEALRYQRLVLESLRLLEAIDQDLSTASVELASLMNVPLAVKLQVVEPSETLTRQLLDMPVEAMEEVAIARNADLREQFYNTRMAAEETRKALLRLFPSLGLSFSLKHDNDQYLVNQSWNETGARLSFNLLNLLSAPTQIRLADAGVALADQRRVATQMAVIAQVRVARLQYANAYQQYLRSDAVWVVDDRINRHVANREQAQTQSKLDRVANNTAAILSQLRRYQSLAQAQAAASKLQATLGMEPEIGGIQDVTLNDLQHAIRTAMANWEGSAWSVAGVQEEAGRPLPPSSAELSPFASTAGVTPVATVSPDVQPSPLAEVQVSAPEWSLPQESPAAGTTLKPPVMAGEVAGKSVGPVGAGRVPVATPSTQAAGGWIVRLGSFRRSHAVSRVVGRTRALALPVFTSEYSPGGTRRTQVRAGPFGSREAAEAARDKLADRNLAGHVAPL